MRGRLQVELLDEQDRSLAGFTGTITGNGLRHVVRWTATTDSKSLADNPVKIRFLLTNGDLYSWAFASHE